MTTDDETAFRGHLASIMSSISCQNRVLVGDTYMQKKKWDVILQRGRQFGLTGGTGYRAVCDSSLRFV